MQGTHATKSLHQLSGRRHRAFCGVPAPRHVCSSRRRPRQATTMHMSLLICACCSQSWLAMLTHACMVVAEPGRNTLQTSFVDHVHRWPFFINEHAHVCCWCVATGWRGRQFSCLLHRPISHDVRRCDGEHGRKWHPAHNRTLHEMA